MIPAANTGVEGLERLHRTRAVLTLVPEKDLFRPAAAYLADHPEITDIILRIPSCFSDCQETEFATVEGAVSQFAGLGRYLCIRLQWAAVQTDPDRFRPDHIARLRALNRFHIASPFRLEFETWWLTAGQITPAHRQLASDITDAGMGIYANTALLYGINTDPEQAQALVHAVRQAGMAFHQVYTGGLEVQKERSGSVTAADVVALASVIRKNCTGREVPLYVRWTPEGERDFGLPGQRAG